MTSSGPTRASSPFALQSFSYGKSLVRLLRVVRHTPTHHSIVEYTVATLLSGPSLASSYTEGDNSLVVATDSQKNTVHFLAKTLPPEEVLCPEKFALRIAAHFPTKYAHIEKCEVEVVSHKWSRIKFDEAGAKEEEHSFVRDGEEKRTVQVVAEQQGSDKAVAITKLQSGLKDLLLLKSGGSAFHSFLRDEFTTLREVKDRIFSTAVDCRYDYALPAEEAAGIVDSLIASHDFDSIASSIRQSTLRIFSRTDTGAAAASVQATLHLMATSALSAPENAAVDSIEYALPNKHYVPLDLKWAALENMKEDEAEVFLPQADPSGLIKAKVGRKA